MSAASDVGPVGDGGAAAGASGWGAHLWLAWATASAWWCAAGMNAEAEVWWAAAWGLAALPAAWCVYCGRSVGRVDALLWAAAGAMGSLCMADVWRWSWGACSALHVGLAPLTPRLRGLRVTGALLARGAALVGLALLLSEALWTRWHVVPGVAQLCWPVLRLSGAHAAALGHSLCVSGIPVPTTFIPSPQHLALDVAVLMPVALWAQGAPRRLPRHAATALGVWLPARYCLLVLLTAQGTGHWVFWRPEVVGLSMAPVLLVGLWVPLHKAAEDGGRTHDRGWGRGASPAGAGACAWRGLAAAAVGGLLVGFAVTYADPGVPKAGRVLIDESHGPWESAAGTMDTEDLSPLSSYNYLWFGRLLSMLYTVETHRLGPLTPAVLAAHDVLVVKVPTQPLTSVEVKTIAAFVRSGGGLWLIGDHTNVFGTSSCLNPLAERFGMQFVADATYPVERDGLPVWRARAPRAHPVAVGVRGDFLVHTSATIRAPLAASVMTLERCRAVAADYSRPHGFPGARAKATEFRFGPQSLCVARRCGRGRVVAFADSTVWSNFRCFIPGKAELALASVAWLNRTSRFGALVPVVAVAGGGLLLAGGLWVRARGAGAGDALLAAAVSGAFLGAALCGAAMRQACPRPQLPRSTPTLCFEGQYSDIFLPIDAYSDALTPGGLRDYQTLYAWALRVGLVPRYTGCLADALRQSTAVAIVNPTRPLAAGDVEGVVRRVEGGGRLLVLLGSERADVMRRGVDNAGLLLGRLGFRATAPGAGPVEVAFGDGGTCRAPAAVSVSGGESLARLVDGTSVAAAGRVGRGVVVVAGVAAAFTTRGLGAPLDGRTAEQAARSRLVFHTLRALDAAAPSALEVRR